MNTHNICFHGEIKKMSIVLVQTAPYMKLWRYEKKSFCSMRPAHCVPAYRIYPEYWDT